MAIIDSKVLKLYGLISMLWQMLTEQQGTI